MPTYSFYCEKCETTREIYRQRFLTSDEENQICECGERMEKEIFAPIGFKFCEKGAFIEWPGYNNENPEHNFKRATRRKQ